MLHYKTEGWDSLSDLDKRNMKRNAMGLASTASIMFLLNLLLGLFGDKDDDWHEEAMISAAILFRMQNDMMFYTTPTSATYITKSMIPAAQSVIDFGDALFETGRIMTGIHSLDYKTGIYAGQNRLTRKWGKLVPYSSLYYSIERAINYHK